MTDLHEHIEFFVREQCGEGFSWYNRGCYDPPSSPECIERVAISRFEICIAGTRVCEMGDSYTIDPQTACAFLDDGGVGDVFCGTFIIEESYSYECKTYETASGVTVYRNL